MKSVRMRWYHSLSGKLFFLMSSCLLFTVSAVTFLDGVHFREFLNQQLRDDAIRQTEDAAQNITNAIEGWQAQMALLIHSMHGSTTVDFKRGLQNFLNANKDFVAVQLWNADSKLRINRNVAYELKQDQNEVRFEGKTISEVSQYIQRLGKDFGTIVKTAEMGDIAIKSHKIGLGLPLTQLTGVYRTTDGGYYIMSLWVWHTRLLSFLPSDKYSSLMVVDSNAQPFFGSDKVAGNALVNDRFVKQELVGKRGEFGYLVFESQQTPHTINAFKRIKDLPLTVLLARDASDAFGQIARDLLRTALIGAIFLLIAIAASYLSAGGVTKGLKILTHATVQIANGNFSFRVQATSKDEVSVLSSSVNHMASKIEHLMQVQVEAARQEKELETARIVQETLFPKEDVYADDIVVSGKFKPASECGGDWWGYFKSASGRHYFLIADATGHGAAAAIVSSLAYASCTTMAEAMRNEGSNDISVGSLLRVVNKVLWQAGLGKTTMTFLAMSMDPRTGDMRVASAGHNMPYIVPASGSDERLNKRRHMKINCKGLPLGFQEDVNFKEEKVSLKAGDKIFLYTDGLIECKSPAGKQWGKKELEKTLSRIADLDAARLKDSILSEAFGFFANTPLEDDVTVVAVEYLQAKSQGSTQIRSSVA